MVGRLAALLVAVAAFPTGTVAADDLALIYRAAHDGRYEAGRRTVFEASRRLGLPVRETAGRDLDAAWLTAHGLADMEAIEVVRGDEHLAILPGARTAATLTAELEALLDALSRGPLPAPAELLAGDRRARGRPGWVLSQHLRYEMGELVPGRTRLLSGAPPPVRGPAPGSWVAQLVDVGGSVLAATSWRPPRLLLPPPPRPGDTPGGAVTLDRMETALHLPYLLEAVELRLFRPYGVLAARVRLDAARLERRARFAARAGREPQLIHGRGRDAKKLVLLFLGDKYRGAGSRKRFSEDVEAHVEQLLDEPTLGGRRQARKLKIYRGTQVRGFDCEHECAGLPQLICCDGVKVIDAAARTGVAVDEIVVLVDNERFGGSALMDLDGGSPFSFAVAYNRWRGLDELGPEVTVHEIGHSIFGLMDEYEYGGEGITVSVNCADVEPCPWNGPGLGCHRGCSYSNLFRATEDHCLMRTLAPRDGFRFCPICAKRTRQVVRSFRAAGR